MPNKMFFRKIIPCGIYFRAGQNVLVVIIIFCRYIACLCISNVYSAIVGIYIILQIGIFAVVYPDRCFPAVCLSVEKRIVNMLIIVTIASVIIHKQHHCRIAACYYTRLNKSITRILQDSTAFAQILPCFPVAAVFQIASDNVVIGTKRQ